MSSFNHAVASKFRSAEDVDFVRDFIRRGVSFGDIGEAVKMAPSVLTAEGKKQEIKQWFQTLILSAPTGIYIMQGGQFSMVNPELQRLTGYSEHELLSMDSLSRIFPEDREAVRAATVKMLKGQCAPPYECRILAKSGEVKWVIKTVSSIEFQGQRAILGNLADITGRKRAEEKLQTFNERLEQRVAERTRELERSNEELEQFAYVASHDLQEPLRSVTSMVQLLAERYSGKLDADADDFIKYAVGGANRMKQLIRDLLAYSRAGTCAKGRKPVDCSLIVDQALAGLRVAVEESGAVVTRDPLPTITADAAQFAQLVQNLLGNAIKFRSEKPPRIHICAQKRKDDWLFSVSDNGIGIAPKHAKRIFVIFQRLHTPEEYPGTGIGLAICKKIVERHGGTIWIESKPGEGATVHFTIPEGTIEQ
jgi:PAS domain S-box-containing protein